MAYTGYPAGYPTAAPTYNPNMYPTTSPGYAPGYTAGTPYKVPPTQSNSAPPPYSPSPNPYQTAMYPIRSAYPQQNLYAQGAYYTQPVYAAQPHVIHHTTVVQPNSIPWDHHGNVSRHFADHPSTHCHRSTSSLGANVQGSRNPYLQLRTSTLVIPLAKPHLESNIVCNNSSLTWVLEQLSQGTKSVSKNKNKRSARVTLCIL
ncbi:Hypothetical predicted protein [Podarcis lilfordi]|uniref:Uncharacterized protein n=1 Tax=Podarcis lilfordi TaxID=74358 RepID=A0AA35KAG3_9SAUR|nr:Hypothetical predicted protein [Podarcis lilfordi]